MDRILNAIDRKTLDRLSHQLWSRARAVGGTTTIHLEASQQFHELRESIHAAARSPAGLAAWGMLLAQPHQSHRAFLGLLACTTGLNEAQQLAVLRVALARVRHSPEGMEYLVTSLAEALVKLRSAGASRLHRELVEDPILGRQFVPRLLSDLARSGRRSDAARVDELAASGRLRYEEMADYLRALVTTKEKAALPVLESLCDHPNATIRDLAVGWLVCESSAAPYLRALLPRLSGEHRMRALEVMARAGDRGAWQAILDILSGEHQEDIARVVDILYRVLPGNRAYYDLDLSPEYRQRVREYWQKRVRVRLAELARTHQPAGDDSPGRNPNK